jgi:hypothetical protein
MADFITGGLSLVDKNLEGCVSEGQVRPVKARKLFGGGGECIATLILNLSAEGF